MNNIKALDNLDHLTKLEEDFDKRIKMIEATTAGHMKSLQLRISALDSASPHTDIHNNQNKKICVITANFSRDPRNMDPIAKLTQLAHDKRFALYLFSNTLRDG